MNGMSGHAWENRVRWKITGLSLIETITEPRSEFYFVATPIKDIESGKDIEERVRPREMAQTASDLSD